MEYQERLSKYGEQELYISKALVKAEESAQAILRESYQKIDDGSIWICNEIYYKEGIDRRYSCIEERRVVMKNEEDSKIQVSLEKFWEKFCRIPKSQILEEND